MSTFNNPITLAEPLSAPSGDQSSGASIPTTAQPTRATSTTALAATPGDAEKAAAAASSSGDPTNGTLNGDEPIGPGAGTMEAAKAHGKPPGMPDFPEGGLWGWMAVAGSWFAIFAAFGYANAFGAFQSYYQTSKYTSYTASDISWIGSVQLFFQFSMGAVAGPLYDKGYFYHLMGAGSALYIVCIFMVSLCTQFWQTILAQAIGLGIAIGLIFLPSVSVISQYFLKRRALAIGISVTGSSVGGICLPIMLNNLIATHGFEKAVQYMAILLTGCLALAVALMHPRLPPRPSTAPKPTPKELFSSKAYTLVVAGLFCVAWGLFFPIYYLQVFGVINGLPRNVTDYTLAILNAASVFGRISPNFFADTVGSINMLTVMCGGAGILCFAVFGAGSTAGLVIVAILFGFFSGAYVSLISPALISLARDFNEIGIRIGMGFLITSLAALTGTPITGALLTRYGFYAPIIWSGVTVLAGTALFVLGRREIVKEKKTWRV